MNNLNGLKILVISNMYPSQKSPNYGTFVRNFCEQLDKIGLKYDKVVMKKDLHKLVSYPIYFLKVFVNILLKKYDVVYVHYASHNALILMLLKKIKNFKIYTNVHGSDVVPQTKVQKMMMNFTKKLLHISDKVIVPSNYFKQLMIERFSITESKIEIYPSAGVDKALFYPYSEDQKSNILIQGSKINRALKYIGYVGRLETKKGWDTFLDMIWVLKEKRLLNDKKFIIVGDGVESDKFYEKINELKISEYIIHIPKLEQFELPDIYNILDVFCFPTAREGESLGLVALEAMACGVPVIASDFAAPKEYVIDGYNGYKFEVGEYNELADKILYLTNLEVSEYRELKKNAFLEGKKYYCTELESKLLKIFNFRNNIQLE